MIQIYDIPIYYIAWRPQLINISIPTFPHHFEFENILPIHCTISRQLYNINYKGY